MEKKRLAKGSITALITPFKKNGSLDRQALEKLVLRQIEAGSDGILCCGTTGENVALSDREKKKIAEICIEAAEKKIPVLVGVGSASTEQTVQLAKEVQKLGASGCSVIAPYYNKPSFRGCLTHFSEVAQLGLPIIIDNNPGRTGTRFTADLWAKICEVPGIIGFKDSSGDLGFVRSLLKVSSIPVWSGDDDLTYDILREGGSGSISVIGNLFPLGWKKWIDLALEKKWGEAKRGFEQYLPVCKALFLEASPQCVKWAAQWMGLAGGTLRLPLVEIEEASQEAIKSAIVNLALAQYKRVTQRSTAGIETSVRR